MKKKSPERTCIVCHGKYKKKQLVRIVKTRDGDVFFYDPSGKAQGRGAYVCKNPNCLEKFLTTNKFVNYFGLEITDNTFTSLREAFNDEE